MSREIILEALNGIRDTYIDEAADKLGLLAAGAAAGAGAALDAMPSQEHLFSLSGTETAAKAGFGAWLAKGGWVALVAGAVAAAGIATGVFFLGKGRDVPSAGTGEVTTEQTDGTHTESDTPTHPCADGHTVEVWRADREIPCYQPGESEGVCTVCGETVVKYWQRTPHVYADGYCSICGMIEGADERFRYSCSNEADGTRTAMISVRDGAIGEKIIFPNVIYDNVTKSMVPVTILNRDLFKYEENLREVVIPDTVHTIGSNTFDHCENLQNVKFPSSLKKIGDMTFTSCNSFTEINLPEGVTEIGDMAFGYCSGLTEVILPESVVTLGSHAFTNCTQLTTIYLPNGITRLNDGLFNGCAKLVDVTIPNQAIYVGSSVFNGCSSLTAMTFPTTVKNMGSSVFRECSSLVSFTYPSGVQSVGVYSFHNCTALQEVILPNSIKSIDAYAFGNCTSLESLHIPYSVKEITAQAFVDCKNLKYLTVEKSNVTYTAIDNCIVNKKNGTLVLGGLNASIPADGSVTFIGEHAFCSRFTEELVIPGAVQTIQRLAFANCDALRTIQFSSGLTAIGDNAFMNCQALERVELPDTVETLGYSVFQNCKSLSYVSVPASMTKMENIPFGGCTSLERVDFADIKSRWNLVTAGITFGNLEFPVSEFIVYCTDGEIREK